MNQPSIPSNSLSQDILSDQELVTDLSEFFVQRELQELHDSTTSGFNLRVNQPLFALTELIAALSNAENTSLLKREFLLKNGPTLIIERYLANERMVAQFVKANDFAFLNHCVQLAFLVRTPLFHQAMLALAKNPAYRQGDYTLMIYMYLATKGLKRVELESLPNRVYVLKLLMERVTKCAGLYQICHRI